MPAKRSTEDQEDYLRHGRFGEGVPNVAASLPVAFWKATSIVGICLIVIAIAAGYIDGATHFNFSLPDYNIFLIGGLIGVAVSSVGLIGWTRRLAPRAQVRMAVLVFVTPWIAAGLFARNDIHGPGAFILVLIIPATILALVLLLMAVLSNSQTP